MAERTPDGAVWAAFLCPREMASLHGIIREMRMPLFNRHDMVRMSFTQSVVVVLEVVAGDDVSVSDLFSFSKFLLLDDVILICNNNVLVEVVVDVSWFIVVLYQLVFLDLQ